MRVSLEKEYRGRYTLEELDQAKQIIAAEKEDEVTAKGWAEYAVNEALKDTGDFMREVLQASAQTAQNYRARDEYGEGSGNMDVYISALARTADGFIEIGAYLSDIWQSGAVDYRRHMYIQRYGRM